MRAMPPRARVATLALLLVSLSCAGGSNGSSQDNLERYGPPVLVDGVRIASVEVVADEALPEGPNRDQFEKYTAAKRLQDEIVRIATAASQMSPDGELAVHVRATGFRLRTGSGAFWAGAMAGADFYRVDVRIERDGAELKRFKTDTSTVLGGIAYASPTRRSQRMIETLAQRILGGI